MSEEEKIEDQPTDNDPQSTENNNISEPSTINEEQSIENMEVHKHPHHITHKKKWGEYLLEFFMLFLAVFLGFVAENYRESIVNREKEHHYMQNMVADLKADTADLNFAIYYQQLWYNHLDSALQIPIDRLKDINTQDTFFYHFFPYYSWMQPFIQNDNNITQLRAGGFNLIRNENTIDSINMVYNFYKGVKFGVDFSIACYWDVVHKAQQLINLPPPPATLEEIVPKLVLQNTAIFIQYNKPDIQQLYSIMTNAKGTLLFNIVSEKQYKKKAEQLLVYLQKEYHLK